MNNADTSIYNTGLTQEEMEGIGNRFHQGLTKREHFAGLAMHGLLSSFGNHDVTDYSEIASDAVMAADALLQELNK